MPLHFPNQPEIRLGKPPLAEVICQVKFSPILRITKEEPSEFQELVRVQFPVLELEQGVLVEFPGPGSEGAPTAKVPPKVYRFRSEDGKTALSLAVDFFALSTNHYTHWTDFARDLELLHNAAQRVYKIPNSNRIGLRYVNRLAPSNTKKTGNELLSLVNSDLTTLLRSSAWSEPLEMLSQILLTDEPAKLILRTAYGKDEKEPFLILDFDYYEEGKLSLHDLIERCNRYHRLIYNAFRWCVTDDALALFDPLNGDFMRAGTLQETT